MEPTEKTKRKGKRRGSDIGWTDAKEAATDWPTTIRPFGAQFELRHEKRCSFMTNRMAMAGDYRNGVRHFALDVVRHKIPKDETPAKLLSFRFVLLVPHELSETNGSR